MGWGRLAWLPPTAWLQATGVGLGGAAPARGKGQGPGEAFALGGASTGVAWARGRRTCPRSARAALGSVVTRSEALPITVDSICASPAILGRGVPY
eukprot:7383715-Prymnesium_polylepis.1